MIWSFHYISNIVFCQVSPAIPKYKCRAGGRQAASIWKEQFVPNSTHKDVEPEGLRVPHDLPRKTSRGLAWVVIVTSKQLVGFPIK